MRENKLFKVASKIATPLSLSSLTLLILYGIYKAIIGLDIFPELSDNASFDLLNNLVNKVFILALVALVLGILAYVYIKYRSIDDDPIHLSTKLETVYFTTEKSMDMTKHTNDSGYSSSFTLRNGHSKCVTIYSLSFFLISFHDKISKEFQKYLDEVPPLDLMLSAPIPVHGIIIRINPDDHTCVVRWGEWDDSAGSRGKFFYGGVGYRKMMELINETSSDGKDFTNREYELLPPSMRFNLAPDESESFYCQFRAEKEGIYKIKLVVSYHCEGKKYEVKSNDIYEFGWVDFYTGLKLK